MDQVSKSFSLTLCEVFNLVKTVQTEDENGTNRLVFLVHFFILAIVG